MNKILRGLVDCAASGPRVPRIAVRLFMTKWGRMASCGRLSTGLCGYAAPPEERRYHRRAGFHPAPRCLDRILPRLAIRPSEKLISSRIARTLHPVPMDAAPQPPTHHPQQRSGCSTVSDFDIAHSLALAPDRIEKIGPQLLDVLTIGVVELRLHMNHLGALLDRVEGPAIAPAHVERTFRAVEVCADQVLLGVVAGVVALLPRRAECLELIGDNLR